MDKPPDSDANDDAPDPGPCRVLIGLVQGDYRDFVAQMTEGKYRVPGDLVSFGILPGVMDNDCSGLLLCAGFKPEGDLPERAEVIRIPYQALLASLIAITEALHSLDVLKNEPMGAQIEAAMAKWSKVMKVSPIH